MSSFVGPLYGLYMDHLVAPMHGSFHFLMLPHFLTHIHAPLASIITNLETLQKI
jgi:hypothetical protein